MEKVKEKEIIEAANIHLHTTDANEALCHFTDDVIAISNEQVFHSKKELKEDIVAYYHKLKKVNFAEWENIQVKLLNGNTGLFTANFKYSFTDRENKTTNLEGIWSAVFVYNNSLWKICFRHETFTIK